MDLKQTRKDFDNGVIVCKGTLVQLQSHAEWLEVENHQHDADIAALTASLQQMWGWARQMGEQFDKHPDNNKTKADWKAQCDEAAALVKKHMRKD